MCSLGIEPMTFALLTQFSTTEPQEQVMLLSYTVCLCMIRITNPDIPICYGPVSDCFECFIAQSKHLANSFIDVLIIILFL